ncbi:MAG: hypothetical protein BLM47_07205 [Candidatus Reconcilbacillus cellulovorans]|uniref:DUF7680 domain-containing protein n=1 Tax=Candidatus Reconcilbacillus cellulovorans TaxID=1906605 RepID=A0A2A6E0I3_9BACL|nr:MAG: hypothetical protein BLM47_07205 [Candidatus Reconcilbacillus cellulovorans]
MARTTSVNLDLEAEYRNRIAPQLHQAPWLLRVTEFRDKPSPVLVVKEKFFGEKNAIKERGLMYGESLRRCLPVIRRILSRICDIDGVPMGLEKFFPNGSIRFRGNLPLNREAGAKLALLFKLQERVSDLDRVELIALRVERFTAEEAAYWLALATYSQDEAVRRWATAGMRILLGGQPGDKAIEALLDKLRK